MNNQQKGGFLRSSLFSIIILIALFIGVQSLFSGKNKVTNEIVSSELIQELKKGNVSKLTLQPDSGVYFVEGEYKKEQKVKELGGLFSFGLAKTKTKYFNSVVLDSETSLGQIQALAEKKGAKFVAEEEPSTGMWISIAVTLLPLLLIGGAIYYMFMGGSQQGGSGGRGVMSFGKMKTKEADKKANNVRFTDVAGAEEEKQELVEVVEFLKDPSKFTALGARIPAGVMLEGPPGTGKTLLARAVAGEAGVPFYPISGSDFVEMFVGVGASRVRDLFETAKKNAPAIVFIDEIDAVGRQRGAGMGGGHDEREQTMNQLLVEMDGFDGNEGVIVIAATNRSDVLDPVLLRSGRFDRRILVGRPDVREREAILHVHAKNKPLSDDVDLKVIAHQTPGFVGADLENVLNEAALVAARRDKTQIDASDIDEAEDRVIAGPAKKDRKVNELERKKVAYHEAGHTIVSLKLSNARVVHKVTIVPRGRAGGYMIALPKEDENLLSKDDMFEQLAGLMGGRVAEEIVFGVKTTGASNDLEQATKMARSMVTEYGMSEKIGPVQYEGNHSVFLGRDYGQGKGYSEQVAYEIDEEVRHILIAAHDKAVEIIQGNREKHQLIAEKLLEFETLNAAQIKALYETGEMPVEEEESVDSTRAMTFEEAKQALEEKDKKEQKD